MKTEYIQQVAERLIEQLEQGTAPWQKPWAPGELKLPYNPTSGKPYRGMNTMWLQMQGRSDPRWMTYKQATAAGAQVRKGEKSSAVVYWKFHEERQMRDSQGKPVVDGDGKPLMQRVELERPKSFMALVFNAEQIDGLPPLEARPMGSEPERHARAEAILARSGAKIDHVEGDRAYYHSGIDGITLPLREQFPTADNYYATALHEVGHWTGHPSRLDRDLSNPFGSVGYAKEELRAEIASLMLGEQLEIGHDPGQHAAYVASWIKVLKDDPREIFRAASDADKIQRYVMGFEQEQSQSVYAGLSAADAKVVDQIADVISRFNANEARATFELGDDEHKLFIADELRLDLNDALKAVLHSPSLSAAFLDAGQNPAELINLDFEQYYGGFERASAVVAELQRPRSGGGAVPSVQRNSAELVTLATVDRDTLPDTPYVAIYAAEDPELVLVTGPAHDQASHDRAAALVANDQFRHVVWLHVPDAGHAIGVGKNLTADSSDFAAQVTALVDRSGRPVAFIPNTGKDATDLAVALMGDPAIKAILEADSSRQRESEQGELAQSVPHKEVESESLSDTDYVAIFAGEDAELVMVTGPTHDQASHDRAAALVANDDFRAIVKANVADAGDAIGVGKNHAVSLDRFADNVTAFLDSAGRPLAFIPYADAKSAGMAAQLAGSPAIQSILESGTSPQKAPEQGDRVRFTPHKETATLQPAEGVIIDTAPTRTGNVRYRIRTDEIAPQDGRPQEWLVYSNQGRFDRLPAREIASGPTPEAAKELAAVHANAVDGYSPLESWRYLESVAADAGYVAAVRVNPEGDAPENANFLVSYSRQDGAPTTIGTGIFLDGKTVTGMDGQRLSQFISNDPDSMRSTLNSAFTKDKARAAPVLHNAPEASTMTAQRTYLAVPFSEKNEAKAMGAKWDKAAKAWYAPEGVDVKASGLARWAVEKAAASSSQETPQQAFATALKNAGLIVKGSPEDDGVLRRVPVEGDKGGEKSGGYALHMEGRIPGGVIINYRTGERTNWKFEGTVPELTPQQRAQLEKDSAERAERREAEQEAKYQATAKIGAILFREAPAATAAHPYCSAKGITDPGENGLRVVPETVSAEAREAGVRIAKTVKQAQAMRKDEPDSRVFLAGDLLVPLYGADGKIGNLQTINPNFKGFVKDGRKAGLFTVAGTTPRAYFNGLESDQKAPILFAEGYATANTVARLADQPCVVAFDSGNLDAVIAQFRERYPERPFLIASDNDHQKPLQVGPDGKPMKNVGLVKAIEAGKAHGAGVMAPQFAQDDKGTDWNDLEKSVGTDAARNVLATEMAKAKTEAAMAAERLMSLARQRDMEARNDPTTSADDARVASERAAASELMARAIAGSEEVRAEANDARATGQSVAAFKATVERTTADLQDEVNEQRELVMHGADEPKPAAPHAEQKTQQQPKRRAQDHGAEL
jgi:antirestriction protein ArdC/phage/plasmid primase-like uncharacterized protein